MTSYLILTPPGAGADDEKARFIRDSFRWSAFFFPAIWLLVHRLWLAGALVLAAQIATATFLDGRGLGFLAFAINLSLSIIVALEGPMLAANGLARRQWTWQGVTSARNLSEAEEIYYSQQENPAAPANSKPIALPPSASGKASDHGPALGLLGYDGGR
ncbi:MAG: DUF2628 domain-containing protein [Shinella sp.]|nr:DUF2628 domain-containing protein [Shinella sp.]